MAGASARKVEDMRIAVLGYAHPFGEGLIYGAERLIYYLIREWRELGHECVVFSVKGCNLPGFEYIEMPCPWEDDRDIYLEAIKEYEVKNNVRFDHVHSFMGSGYISHDLRSQWPFSIEPFFNLPRITENKIVYSKKIKSVSGGIGTLIYHGIPEWIYSEWDEDHDNFLLWIGRMDPGKCPDIAIDIAKRAGEKLILIGPSYHYPYCHDHVLPHIDGEQIIWLRGCEDRVKQRVWRRAKCLINPIFNGYHEMLGVINLESLACGVPVIGWGNAQEPSAINYNGGEIIEHGVHGFIINHNGYSHEQREQAIQSSVEAIKQIDSISRESCRRLYERRFTSQIMAVRHLRFFGIIKERGSVVDVTGELDGI